MRILRLIGGEIVRRRMNAVIVILTVLVIGTCLLMRTSSVAAETEARPPVLKEVFKKDFLVGVAINRAQIFEEDSLGVPIIKAQFNIISPENILKWESVHPEPDRYDFSGADRYVSFGEKNHMTIIGHTLVWHNQTPKWVFEDGNGKPLSRDALLERLHEHISKVVGRYKGKIRG